jgi:hypothetical protein
VRMALYAITAIRSTCCEIGQRSAIQDTAKRHARNPNGNERCRFRDCVINTNHLGRGPPLAQVPFMFPVGSHFIGFALRPVSTAVSQSFHCRRVGSLNEC